MSFDFNPRPKDDKGVGQVDIGKPQDEGAKQQGAHKKWLMLGGAGVGAVALVTIFALSSGGDNAPAPQQPAPRAEQTQPLPRVETPGTPSAAEIAAQIRGQSIADKQAAIYRDDATVYRDQYGQRGEIYIDRNGREVRPGEDFAVHASLFANGGMSVLIAEGPHAGTRIGIFPAPRNGRPSVEFGRVGRLGVGHDGTTPRFYALPAPERSLHQIGISNLPTSGVPVTIAANAREILKEAREGNEYYPAFVLRGTPEQDGRFEVQIWNQDSYRVDLNTGSFTMDSAFLFFPNYQEEFERTGVELDPSRIPLVNGRLPRLTPVAAPAPQP